MSQEEQKWAYTEQPMQQASSHKNYSTIGSMQPIPMPMVAPYPYPQHFQPWAFPVHGHVAPPFYNPYVSSRLDSHPSVRQNNYHTEDIEASLTSQPAIYQIANYNIHPAPVFTFGKPLSNASEISAVLVDIKSRKEIQEGFQSGASRGLKPGSTSFTFSGLKLNSMRRIKNEMRQKKLMNMEKFFIRFKIDNVVLETEPFKLASSCTQIPADLKKAVRPTKKRRSSTDIPQTPTSTDENTDEQPESQDPTPMGKAEATQKELDEEEEDMENSRTVSREQGPSAGGDFVYNLLKPASSGTEEPPNEQDNYTPHRKSSIQFLLS